MYLYNSATHKKEEFRTHTPNRVEMYTCGPTVYHSPISATSGAISWRTCWRNTCALWAST